MSIDAIVEKITRDAREQCEQLLEAAESEKADRIAEEKKEIEKSLRVRAERLEERMADLTKRMENHVRKQAEQKLLNARSRMIDEAIWKAVQQLSQADEREYLEMISSLLERTALEGEIEVVICPADEGRITPDFLSRFSTDERRFVLSEQRHDEKGGVILRTGKISQNATFTMIAGLAHQDLVMRLSTELPVVE